MDAVKSVQRAMQIFDCFSEEKNKLGLSDITRIIDAPKATTFRILETLAEGGFLIKSPDTKTYQLGYKFLRYGAFFLHGIDLRTVALPIMTAIRDETDESVSLYTITEGKRVCIERIETRRRLRPVDFVGAEAPRDKGAGGKVFLAFQHTATGEAAFDAELEQIRQLGFSVTHSEREEGISAVGFPIFGHEGAMIAVLTASGPTFRYKGEQFDELVRVLRNHVNAISTQMGCPAERLPL